MYVGVMDSAVTPVALRKESVDRNFCVRLQLLSMTLSLSARRAWIEIKVLQELFMSEESLSARRAWIEMRCGRLQVVY